MIIRLAVEDDVPAISSLMDLAISQLQKGFLSEEQIEASRAGMGLDLQLIKDGTYFCVEETETIIGCGGWSRRATLYGGDHSDGRDMRLLDSNRERARIRAMYTHPKHTRKGVGSLILKTSENAAKAEGFRACELAGTMAGKPLYLAQGYEIESEWEDTQGGVPFPLATMVKLLV